MIGVATAVLLAPGDDLMIALAQQAESQVMTTTTNEAPPDTPKLPAEQIDSLVAPIALYADPLLANTLAASTYPLEIIQLQQWLDKNKDLKDKALADAVAKQPWDPSVQSMAATPEVVQRMAGNIQWTTDLGNVFLAQQSDVMAAVQRMRAKAQGTGNLKTSAQQVVETEAVEGGQQVIVVKQADPETVYVPSYDSTVVYGAAPPAIPIIPTLTRVTLRERPWPSAVLWLGAQLGTIGATVTGTATATSTSTTITISTRTTSTTTGTTSVTGPDKAVGIGSITHSIAVTLPTETGERPVSMAEERKGSNALVARTALGIVPVAEPEMPQVIGPAVDQAGDKPIGPAVDRAVAKLIGPVAEPVAGKLIVPGGGQANRPSGGQASRPSGGGASRPSGGGDKVGNRSVSSGSRGGGGSSAMSGSRGGYSGGSARASSSRGGHSMGGGGMSRGGGGGGRGGGGGGGRRR